MQKCWTFKFRKFKGHKKKLNKHTKFNIKIPFIISIKNLNKYTKFNKNPVYNYCIKKISKNASSGFEHCQRARWNRMHRLQLQHMKEETFVQMNLQKLSFPTNYQYMCMMVARKQGNITAAAATLGVSRYNRITFSLMQIINSVKRNGCSNKIMLVLTLQKPL